MRSGKKEADSDNAVRWGATAGRTATSKLSFSPKPLDFLLAAKGLPIAGRRTFPILEHALPCLEIRLVKKLQVLTGVEVLEQEGFRLLQHLETDLHSSGMGMCDVPTLRASNSSTHE